MILDMSGLNTQTDAMNAIGMFIEDYENGFMSGIEFITGIKTVHTEWSI